MKVLVIGATGGTGRLAVDRLLGRGEEVTAFARDPRRVAVRPGLRVARGEAHDAPSLAAAVAGQDAVLSAFGPRWLASGDLQEIFMGNLLAAMARAGVQRLVNLSAWGAGDSRDQAGLVMKLFLATFLRQMFADKDRGEALLVASTLDYVNVRPGQLTNGPARGGVKAALRGEGLKPLVSRADLAAFMVDQLRSDLWRRQSPLIGY